MKSTTRHYGDSKWRPMEYTEDDVADAILDITDQGLSHHQEAKQYGIPRSTISDRLRGQEAQENQLQPNQRVTKDYEARIKASVLQQKSLGYGLSHNQIRAGVEALLKQRGNNTPLGVSWVSRFVKKHPKLKPKGGRVQETVRFEAFTPKAVN
jgi:hypothetical protein